MTERISNAASRPELPKRGVGGPPACPDCGAISGGNATCSTCRSHWPGGDPANRVCECGHRRDRHFALTYNCGDCPGENDCVMFRPANLREVRP